MVSNYVRRTNTDVPQSNMEAIARRAMTRYWVFGCYKIARFRPAPSYELHGDISPHAYMCAIGRRWPCCWHRQFLWLTGLTTPPIAYPFVNVSLAIYIFQHSTWLYPLRQNVASNQLSEWPSKLVKSSSRPWGLVCTLKLAIKSQTKTA